MFCVYPHSVVGWMDRLKVNLLSPWVNIQHGEFASKIVALSQAQNCNLWWRHFSSSVYTFTHSNYNEAKRQVTVNEVHFKKYLSDSLNGNTWFCAKMGTHNFPYDECTKEVSCLLESSMERTSQVEMHTQPYTIEISPWSFDLKPRHELGTLVWPAPELIAWN